MGRRIITIAAVVLGALAILGGPALAQDETTIETLSYDLDVVWVALCAGLVFLMQAGFAMLEAGLTQSKNAGNIVAKNLADFTIAGLAYFAVGAALAYGADAAGVIGTSGFFDPEGIEGLGDGVQFVYQLVFAATAATIISGAVAGRMKFSAYLVISAVMTALIYPIVSHWQWGGGWLSELGYYDFAGSSIVHMTGGVAALAGAAILGPRLGKFAKDGKPRAMPGHSIPFAILGVFILWFGWFGFNGGSTLAATGQGETIGHVLLTTNVAAAAGAALATSVIWMRSGKPDPTMAGNGALAGLVGITAAPDYASGIEALLIGAVCGAVVVFAVLAIDRVKIDDPVGAIAVHGVCGAIGTMAVGLYADARADGITLATQAIGVLAIAAFVAVTATLLFLALKATIGLRVSAEDEVAGLDVSEHGVAGYPGAMLGGDRVDPGPASGGTATAGAPSATPPSARPATE